MNFDKITACTANVMNDLIIATAKIIESSKASVLFFENVPQFCASPAWESLNGLINKNYPFWTQKEIEDEILVVLPPANEPALINT